MIRQILLCLVAAAATWGQELPERVGRLGYVYGEVSFRAADAAEWTAANTNEPLSNGDALRTGADSQAEVHVASTAVHLAPQTAFSVVLLDSRVFRMGFSAGALNVRIPRMNEGELVEVATPRGTFRLSGVGAYRLDAPPEAGYVSLTVRSGAGEAIVAGRAYAVAPGERLVLSGDPATAEILEAPAPDPWDEWCASRDEFSERSLEAVEQYVSWETSGAEELAQYGDWEVDETYGACWRPRRLPAGWAPYRFGHWIYKLPWGWTWIDDAPWGFTPSHYGGWLRVRGGLAWVPGRREPKPRYSPARVAFSHRDGPHVAWIPLGPGETPASRTHRNRAEVTAAPLSAFAASKPIAPVRVAIFDRGATTFGERAPEIRPARDSARGAGRPAPAEPVGEATPRPSPSNAGQVITGFQAPAEARRQPRADQRRETDDAQRIADEVGLRENLRLQADDEQRRADENRRHETLQRQMEGLRAADEQRQADDRRRAEEQRQSEEHRRADDSRRVEESRRADDNRRAEENRRAEDSRRAEEARRADENRRAEDQRRSEEHRRAEDTRRTEENRRAEESRRADDARRADDNRRTEESRRAEENRKNEEARKK